MPIGYCRLLQPSPTSAMRERLNGILRCAAWRFLRLSFEFLLRARSSAQPRYTLKTTERLYFSADLHFFPSVNFPALEVRMPNYRELSARRRPLSGALKAHLLAAHLLCPCDEPACNSAIVEQRGRIFRNAERLNRFFSFHSLWIDLNDRRTLHLRKQRLGGVGCFKHWLERRVIR
jgi:hypothetical protein